ncbi:DMT family transporter [Actinokineospora inagensis]|uniref:DMT family transporter n=1 Tax=Actinokineospora inagensis TaxID=103730 RepID=UPI00047BA66E|nr:DMT family transporter [Actinokineospora inagensis]
MVSSRGTLLRMGALALVWGSSFLWIKLALRGLDPVQITATRCTLGALVVLGLCLSARYRLPRSPGLWARMVVVAFFGSALPFTLFGIGERTVDSGVAGVLNATTPLWALLIGIVLRSERDLRPVRLGGLLLGFAGTTLIFAPWQQAGLASWGSLIILAGAASYAVSYAYVGRLMTGSGTAPLALSATQLVISTTMAALVLPVGGLDAVHLSPAVLISVGILGVFGTGVAFAINYRLIADEGPTNATTVGYLLPVVSVLLGAAFLGEGLNLRVIAGMVVVLVGVGMTRWRKKAPSPVLAEDTTGALAGTR